MVLYPLVFLDFQVSSLKAFPIFILVSLSLFFLLTPSHQTDHLFPNLLTSIPHSLFLPLHSFSVFVTHMHLALFRVGVVQNTSNPLFYGNIY